MKYRDKYTRIVMEGLVLIIESSLVAVVLAFVLNATPGLLAPLVLLGAAYWFIKFLKRS
jgi:hypothetical protein